MMIIDFLASSPHLKTAWGHYPILLHGPPFDLSLDDLSQHFLLASRSFPATPWTVEPWLGEPEDALQNGGTLVVNGAAETVPKLADLAKAAIDRFELPSSINVYATRSGEAAPPHCDMQEVLALQTRGSQVWRVWPPPNPIQGLDDLCLGKFEEVQVGECEHYNLSVGDVLYVPAGWVHATATETGSVHATLGFDLVAFGLEESWDPLTIPPLTQEPTHFARQICQAQRTHLYTFDDTWARRYRAYALSTTKLRFGHVSEEHEGAIDEYIRRKLELRVN